MKINRTIQKKKRKKRVARDLPSRKERKTTWLNLLPDDVWLRVKRGITIYEALQHTDLDMNFECGGLGTCGKCKIRIVTALGPPDQQEEKLLTRDELDSGVRLACRTRIKKSLVVYTDMRRDREEMFQILKHGVVCDIKIEPLIEKVPARIAPPDTAHGDSDFKRLRNALGPGYQHIKVTHQCLASLYKNLRQTAFSGEALLHQGCLLSWAPAGSAYGRYGVIFDIGTTTLVGKLIDLTDGREKAVISRLNSQTRYGTNVIRRIEFIRTNPKGLQRMQQLLMRDLNAIVRRLVYAADIDKAYIFIAVAAGNTTMQHILLGLDPSDIAVAPFTPVITEGVSFPSADVGLDINRDAMLYVMPAKSGYIGGDLISFILSSMIWEQEKKIILGLDFGTNGEIFLGNGRRLLSCSAAAGPALEGARISCGMIAKSGAIESFRIVKDQLQYNIIGNVKPRGLCGSGLVDLTALLAHHGAVDVEGLLSPMGLKKDERLFQTRLTPHSDAAVFDFTIATETESFHGRRILLSQKDIRELQLAKSAVAAGVQLLMQEMGINAQQIDEIYLAGALGNYVNPLSAMRIGLIPTIDRHRVLSLGNAASTGATMALLSRSYWETALTLADQIEHIELSLHPDFYDTFIEQMNFPDQDLW
ncbi:MAG: DUF4445 domain-containing protein [Desulfatitalea sp.]|nr:DUF4445 domain-containing protein [Desulfatitalea sp.]NNK01888.1 DUF4445 domain-containing protein [Desulfatitalea sp.]